MQFLKQSNQKGFSLVELTIVVGVIGIVLYGAIAGLSEFRQVDKQQESKQNLANIKQQLIKFAMINKYLPCPDTSALGARDGRENRNANECTRDFGGVPYHDIGLRREDVEDAYGNPIRYAVNTDADNVATICDAASSASYFCNLTPGSAVFNFVSTPPLAGSAVFPANDGAGNYTVCNSAAANCNAGTPANQLLTSSASAVLVSYGNLGPDGENPGGAACTGTSAEQQENCDVNDNFYFQAAYNDDPANEFDDVIEFITGYEIKSEILSPITVWNSLGSIPPPTFRGYDLTAADNYNVLDVEGTPDVIQVDHDITTNLNLGSGDDYVLVGNDLSSELVYDNNTGNIIDEGTQAQLDTGKGNDTVYIVGDANSDITLGLGDDRIVLGKDLTKSLTGNQGNDQVWIQGDVESSSTLDLGNNNDVLYLGKLVTDSFNQPVFIDQYGDDVVVPYQNGEPVFKDADGNSQATRVSDGSTVDIDDISYKTTGGDLNTNVDGGNQYDILVLETMTEADWDSDALFRSRVDDFELVVFKKDINGVREHQVWDGSSWQ